MKVRKRVNRSGSVSWQLDMGIVSGKRKQYSYETKEAALAALTRKKDERRAHGDEAIVMPDSERRRLQEARDALAEHGATIEEAVEFFIRHHQPRENITLDALIERCALAKESLNKRPKYVRELKRTGKAFAREGYGPRGAHRIEQREVEQWIKGNGWSPKSQIVYLIDLSTIFEWGIKHGHVTINPCKNISRPELDQKPPEILTIAQCARLLKAALATEAAALRRGIKLQLVGYIAVCLFAGIRPEETQRLTWDEVHLAERFIEVPALKSKTRRRRIVAISENLAACLEHAEVKEGSIAPPGLAKRLRTLRTIAEIDHWPTDVLRHSFASYHLAQHGSAEKTALQMGHAGTQMLFAHYRELVRPADAAAFWELKP